ncbi:hypothetical protein M5E88_04655 [Akkermansia muciniphila]|nr:hypothetical protein M5E88_04655 [Akkermansia muciniphila]
MNAIELVENRETKKAFRPSSGWGTGFTGKPLNGDCCSAPGRRPVFQSPLVISPEEMEEAVSICASCIRKVLG